MKISVNRLCQLAGIENRGRSRSGRLSEGSNRSFHDEAYYQDEVDYRYGKNQLSEEKGVDETADFFGEGEEGDPKQEMMGDIQHEDEDPFKEEKDPFDEAVDEKLDEVIEIDERMLVQELRRAKRLMSESRNNARRHSVNRSRINSIVEEEVASLMSEYQQSSSWVYGKNKPTNSRKGRVTTTFPGIGFGGKKF